MAQSSYVVVKEDFQPGICAYAKRNPSTLANISRLILAPAACQETIYPFVCKRECVAGSIMDEPIAQALDLVLPYALFRIPCVDRLILSLANLMHVAPAGPSLVSDADMIVNSYQRFSIFARPELASDPSGAAAQCRNSGMHLARLNDNSSVISLASSTAMVLRDVFYSLGQPPPSQAWVGLTGLKVPPVKAYNGDRSAAIIAAVQTWDDGSQRGFPAALNLTKLQAQAYAPLTAAAMDKEGGTLPLCGSFDCTARVLLAPEACDASQPFICRKLPEPQGSFDFNGLNYRFFTVLRASWHEARAMCRELSMELATITSDLEMETLETAIFTALK